MLKEPPNNPDAANDWPALASAARFWLSVVMVSFGCPRRPVMADPGRYALPGPSFRDSPYFSAPSTLDRWTSLQSRAAPECKSRYALFHCGFSVTAAVAAVAAASRFKNLISCNCITIAGSNGGSRCRWFVFFVHKVSGWSPPCLSLVLGLGFSWQKVHMYGVPPMALMQLANTPHLHRHLSHVCQNRLLRIWRLQFGHVGPTSDAADGAGPSH